MGKPTVSFQPPSLVLISQTPRVSLPQRHHLHASQSLSTQDVPLCNDRKKSWPLPKVVVPWDRRSTRDRVFLHRSMQILLDGAELLVCGLATHFVPSERLSLLEEALCQANSSDPAIISAIIDEFSHQPSLKEKSVLLRLDIINNFFSRRTVEDILSALEREAVNTTDEWISSTIKSLKIASPTSLKITLRAIREGRVQGVGQCLISEFRMACHVLQGKFSKDFIEGCRAILVDKDKNPKWEPSKLELVCDDMINQYFSKMDDEDWEDLKLPARSNLPVHAIAKL